MIISSVSRVLFFPSSSSRATFSIARERSSFCSRYIFSSPLLVQLAVQGRNLLETSFLSTSSPLHLPFNLFLRPFLRLRFRSSRPSSSSSWILPSDFSSSCIRVSSPHSSIFLVIYICIFHFSFKFFLADFSSYFFFVVFFDRVCLFLVFQFVKKICFISSLIKIFSFFSPLLNNLYIFF